jgi:hypothetical protein
MKPQTIPPIAYLIARRRREYGRSRLCFINTGFALLLLLTGMEGYAQNIEKMKKKELQAFLSAKITETDSLKQVLGRVNDDFLVYFLIL